MRSLLALFLVLVGCPSGKVPEPEDSGTPDDTAPPQEVDADRDGYTSEQDCDDGNAAVYPGAAETCDGLDNNCDGEADEGVKTISYEDEDGDGFGDPSQAVEECGVNDAHVGTAGDCDDANPYIHPGAEEICDGDDNDCDGETDEVGANGEASWFADADADGYGDPAVETISCDPPVGAVDDNTDCDDLDPAVHPDADESCDGLDNNCDGAIDGEDSVDAEIYYQDADHDYYGDESISVLACDKPSGYRPRARDCDDDNPYVRPGAAELCDDQINNCDDDSWTEADEAGLVAWEDDAGTWSDLTADFSGRVDLADGGTLWVCAGTYTVDLRADGVGLEILGPQGARETILEAHGGAVLSASSDAIVSVSGVAITGGTGRGSDVARGGGIYVRTATVNLDEVLVAGNSATRGGGIYLNGGAVTLNNSLVVANTAETGGGVYVTAGELSCTGVVDVELGIEANVASSGAGVYVLAGNFTADTCDFGDGEYDNLNTDGSVEDVLMSSTSYAFGYDESFSCVGADRSCD